MSQEPLKIIPHPTVDGIHRALDAKDGGFSVAVAKIQVGQGKQIIELDNAGRALTNTLADPVGYLDVLNAEQVNGNQWRMVVDLRQIDSEEWIFSEFALCDAENNVIAIYGNADQSLFAVTPYLTNALLAANLLLAAFPANAITIEHQNLPLELFNDELAAGIIRNATQIETDRNEQLGKNEILADENKSTDLRVQRTEDNLKLTDETLSVYNSKLMELATLISWSSEAEAKYKRSIGQSGLLSVRQYGYHGYLRRPFTENGQPAHMHNHPQYQKLQGSGEVRAIINGWLIGTRHRDYSLYTPDDVGSAFGSTKYITPPPQPPQLQIGSVSERIEALRDLFIRYQGGEMPEGFGWSLSSLEVFFVPFEKEVQDFYSSPRHQQEINSVNAALRSVIRYSSGGARNLNENEAFEMPLCRVIAEDGTPVIGILKHRMTACDVTSLGDLRGHLEQVDDPIRSEGWGLDSRRFLIKENTGTSVPGMLDKMMQMQAGLEGTGANLVERYNTYRATYSIYDIDDDSPENAAYYSRFVRTLDDDASGRTVLQRGFSDPYLFTALTTHPEVLNTPIDDIDYRFSWAIPMELILRTPIEEFNPLNIPEVSTITGKGTEEDPYNGYNKNIYYRMMPDQFFSGIPIADDADTVGAGVWATGSDGQAYKVRESGHWVELPSIAGVSGNIRQRYSIFPDHQEGGKGWNHSEAVYKQSQGLAASIIKNTIDISKIKEKQN